MQASQKNDSRIKGIKCAKTLQKTQREQRIFPKSHKNPFKNDKNPSKLAKSPKNRAHPAKKNTVIPKTSSNRLNIVLFHVKHFNKASRKMTNRDLCTPFSFKSEKRTVY